jgi:hypothetical protein
MVERKNSISFFFGLAQQPWTAHTVAPFVPDPTSNKIKSDSVITSLISLAFFSEIDFFFHRIVYRFISLVVDFIAPARSYNDVDRLFQAKTKTKNSVYFQPRFNRQNHHQRLGPLVVMAFKLPM